jgi:hypothetical protein
MLQYQFTAGSVHTYALQMRVTVQIERKGDGPVSQIAEITGRLVATVDSVDETGALLSIHTEQLQGEVPGDGFFGEADVGDPLAAIPPHIRVGPRGDNDGPVDPQQDATAGTLDTLFPPLPEGVVKDGDVWSRSSSENEAEDPLVVHARFIGREAGDDAVIRPIVGTFSGHEWSAGSNMEGVQVQGETRRMAEVSFRSEDGWAHRVDARVESTLRIGSDEAENGARTIQTIVEMLLEAQD